MTTPFHRILMYTGSIIFTIDFKQPSIRITKWNYIAVFLIIVSNTVMGCSYWTIDFFFSFTIQIADKSEPFLIFVDHFITIFTIYWIFRHRHGVVRMLNMLNEIDGIFMDHGVDVDHERYRKVTIIVTACCWIYAGIMSIFMGYMMNLYASIKGIFLAIFSIWVYWMSLSFQLHYGFIVYAISIRCNMLTIWIKEQPINIQKLSKIHLRLVDVIKLFNTIYSQVIMLFIGSLFIWNCFGAFAITIMRKATLNEFLTSIALVLNLSFSTLMLIFVISYCERIVDSRDAMIENLYSLKHQILRIGCDDDEISGLIGQILNTSMRIRCSFFDINWKFIFHFLAASIMYLFILIQYEDYLNTRTKNQYVDIPLA